MHQVRPFPAQQAVKTGLASREAEQLGAIVKMDFGFCINVHIGILKVRRMPKSWKYFSVAPPGEARLKTKRSFWINAASWARALLCAKNVRAGV